MAPSSAQRLLAFVFAIDQHSVVSPRAGVGAEAGTAGVKVCGRGRTSALLAEMVPNRPMAKAAARSRRYANQRRLPMAREVLSNSGAKAPDPPERLKYAVWERFGQVMHITGRTRASC